MSESVKPATIRRRMLLGTYDRMAQGGIVLDIGAGPDTPTYDWTARVRQMGGPMLFRKRYEVEDGDAQTLTDIPACSYGSVYASHILEHLADPREALHNWLRVTKVGGRLFIAVPHRRLYEYGKDQPPSYWAGDQHLWFFEPEKHGHGKVLGFADLLVEPGWKLHPENVGALGMAVRVEYFGTGDWGYQGLGTYDFHVNRGMHPTVHPQGEYQIEAELLRIR